MSKGDIKVLEMLMTQNYIEIGKMSQSYCILKATLTKFITRRERTISNFLSAFFGTL